MKTDEFEVSAGCIGVAVELSMRFFCEGPAAMPYWVSMTPDEARGIAAELLAAANRADGVTA